MKTVLVFVLAFTTFSYAQNYTALDTTSYDKTKVLKSNYESEFEVFNKAISQDYSGKLKKEIIRLLEERQAEILKMFSDRSLLFDNEFNEFLETSLDTILIHNPEIKEDYTLLLSKSPSPNAFSIGYNTVMVNMGLFKYLENEYQLRSVIMHELAHDMKKHNLNAVVNIAKINLSNDSKKAIQDINNAEYNKGGLAFKRMRALLINQSQKNQKEELEADSLGYVLYENTKWPIQSFANSFIRLKTFEDAPSLVLDSTIYSRLFDLEDQPFKAKWLEKEDFSAYNYSHFKEKISADSIASHPELTNRIAKIRALMPKDHDSTIVKPNESFSKLQYKSVFQQVANLFDLKEYGASLYSTLILLENYPDNAYLLKYVGLNFNEIYNAQKAYTLNRYVEKLNPQEQSDSYNLFLNFIWNLRLSEMKTIADYYTSIYP
ncbi:M48 family metalloprotease [Hyunsoonleella ulvae]|uniref:M48 family metalloprotease n=1 Tax=Hyunsoonleella ulvae TaxID=2799948 RepID=UPI00193AC424|nr:M48 family metalloprotease [Hyunsoonleella ulvae]